MSELNPALVQRMCGIGAEWIALVRGVDYDLQAPQHLEASHVKRAEIVHQREVVGTLDLYRLQSSDTEVP
jgi:hypothetical protein